MRLIDADALCEGLVSNHPVAIAAACAPTIDVVEIVRCRDCKYNAPSYASPDKFRFCSLQNPWKQVAADFFCAHGEKMNMDKTKAGE